MVVEKSGVLNLGQEGMMLVGVVMGFIVILIIGSLFLGFVCVILVGIVMLMLFGLLMLKLNLNQYVIGLVLIIFGIGLFVFIGVGYVGKFVVGLEFFVIFLLNEILVIGKVFFQQDLIVYGLFFLMVFLMWFFSGFCVGLIVKVVGESLDFVNVIGLLVLCMCFLVVVFGGVMVGLVGGYLLLVYILLWVENMSVGCGWIVLVLVVFVSWCIGWVILGVYLFGLVSILYLVV